MGDSPFPLAAIPSEDDSFLSERMSRWCEKLFAERGALLQTLVDAVLEREETTKMVRSNSPGNFLKKDLRSGARLFS